MRASALTLCLLLAATPALAASADWTRDATAEDISRIERLPAAWDSAITEARQSNGPEVARLSALVDPRAGLPNPEPAPGRYRCRVYEFGDRGVGIAYIAYPWFQCRIDLSPGGDLTLKKLTGSQRTSGNLYPSDRRKLVYLGAEAWADEAPLAYRQNPERDQAGVFERIGPRRYRLVMPWPKYDSNLDILELTPAP